MHLLWLQRVPHRPETAEAPPSKFISKRMQPVGHKRLSHHITSAVATAGRIISSSSIKIKEFQPWFPLQAPIRDEVSRVEARAESLTASLAAAQSRLDDEGRTVSTLLAQKVRTLCSLTARCVVAST